MYNIRSVVESASALSRFRVHSGTRVASSNNTNSYILLTKLKRILKAEITNESFSTLKFRYFSKKTEARKEVFLDRLISRIEIFDLECLQYALGVYESEGVFSLVDTIRLPQRKLKKLSAPFVIENNPLDEDYSYPIPDDDVLIKSIENAEE
jgi:hypothetical protein